MVKKRNFFAGVLEKSIKTKGQTKIMQMAFMIIGVFLFFVLVGIFVFGIMIKDVRSSAQDLARDEAISSIEGIALMSELSYNSKDSMAIDEDKIRILSGMSDLSGSYEEFWPIASLEIYKVYPVFDSVIPCPALDCNYYNVMSSEARNVEKFSSFVSICKRVRESGSVFDRCEIGKIVVGVKYLGGDE